MDYINKESTEKTFASYMQAFEELSALCLDFEPEAMESNNRIALPTRFRPVGGYKRELLLSHCNHISINHEKLFEYGRPLILSPSMWKWCSDFFQISLAIYKPFSLYRWDYSRQVCEGGFDEEGNCIGGYKTIPAQMREWCSPQYIRLDIPGMKLGLGDWYLKQNELTQFGKLLSADLQDKYEAAIQTTQNEVTKWENAIDAVAGLRIPR